MHTYFLAPVFLSAVTASPLQDFSPLGYVLPSSGQPNDAPNAFQDFFARTSTNPDSYIQPQIQAKSLGERLGGDPASGNEAIPHSAASQYLQSDLKFQRAPCGATSSVCCQRAYNGESSQSATCAASMYSQSPFSFLLSPNRLTSGCFREQDSIRRFGSNANDGLHERQFWTVLLGASILHRLQQNVALGLGKPPLPFLIKYTKPAPWMVIVQDRKKHFRRAG